MTVNGTKLSMTRGDSETITVICTAAPFDTGDVLTMTVREDNGDDGYGNIVLQKVIGAFEADGTAIINIAPGDTADLEFTDYIYDIQVTRADGTVTTIIKPAAFTITEEVTY